MNRLDKQAVLVVGGSSGIGAATARLFAQEGAQVTIASRSADKLAKVADAVSPGTIETPLWDKMDAGARQAMFDATAAKLPARRIGQPEDIAQAVLYLATNGYATGSTVLVDGGGAIS